jgi:hypothetical protein
MQTFTMTDCFFFRKNISLKSGIDKVNGVAYASFKRSQNKTGWGVLDVVAGHSSVHYDDEVIMKAAGYLEGALTYREIYDTYRSQSEFWLSSLPDDQVSKVKKFYSDQREWMEANILSLAQTSSTWSYTNLIYKQFAGMMEGYAFAAPNDMQLQTFAFDLLTGNGDWLDIRNFVDQFNKSQINQKVDIGHCSALIKVLPGFENIFAAHSR